MIIGTNTAIFDGIDMETTFKTIRDAGFSVVEMAYNEGYVGNLNDYLFSDENANQIIELLNKYELETYALGCTMNLAKADAIDGFKQRISLANKIGATYLNACVGKKEDYAEIVSKLKILAPIAEDNGCVICIENGGDHNFDLVSVADDAFLLLDDIDHPAVAINLDPGNTVSLIPDIDAIQESLKMMPVARHAHIKDVMKKGDEYYFPPIGDGQLDYHDFLAIAEKKGIPCNLEIPQRMHRLPDATPLRGDEPVDPAHSLTVLKRSKAAIEKLTGETF